MSCSVTVGITLLLNFTFHNVQFTEAAGLLPRYSGQTFLAAITACLLLGSDTSSFALWDIHRYLLSCFVFVLWVIVLLERAQ